MAKATLTALIAALATATSASAQTDALPTDPSPDSPSGTIYELPLDAARVNAAPQPKPQGAGIRSENDFGSSTVVPGAKSGGNGPGNPRDDEDLMSSAERGDRRPASSDESPADDLSSASGSSAAEAFSSAADEGPSPTLAFAVLIAIGLAGAAFGTAVARARRRGYPR